MLEMIAAVAKNGVIGKENRLPWHIPEDLKLFKRITTGRLIVMGQKTWQSLGCKPLPNRQHLILSRTPTDECSPVHRFVTDVPSALEVTDGDAIVIGGGEIYRLFLPYIRKLHITHVNMDVEGDAFFPEVDYSKWDLVAEETLPGAVYRCYEKIE